MQLSATAGVLRDEVVKVLRAQGYAVTGNSFYIPNLQRPPFPGNEGRNTAIRRIHIRPREERMAEHINFIHSFTHQAKYFMRDHSDLDVLKIRPRLIEVKAGTIYADLFRWWNLTWWSLPYERSYGRQMRFLIWDDSHDAPMGLIGLQSPILNWSVRDKHLGITKEMRDFWVNQSMNAQRLGALPPYNRFLGGKLVALLMASDFIRERFKEKYKSYETVLLKRKLPANLLFVTTTGAYGKSSVYNRLRFNENRVCDFIGYTHGSGSFHIPNSLYEGFVQYLKDNNLKSGRSFGNGPSAKMKIIERAMGLLGFRNGVGHGVKRAVYLFRYARNIEGVIHRGEAPVWENRNQEELAQYWKERWAIKRTGNYPQDKLKFEKEEYLAKLKLELEESKRLILDDS